MSSSRWSHDPIRGPAGPRIAYFVSPHGFGHAARASAVMEAVHRADPSLSFDIFTTAPEWFFADSLSGRYRYHPVATDVGLVQQDPLHEDLAATARALERMIPFRQSWVLELAATLRDAGSSVVVCDIAAVGLAAAREAGLPSVLVENFTWDWLYQPYAADEPALEPFPALFAEAYGLADVRVQTEPPCQRHPGARQVGPVGRAPKRSPDETRARLGAPDALPIVLLSMGGFRFDYGFLDLLEESADYFFVVPGGSRTAERRGNLLLLPERSGHFHPDLVAAADAVIGKFGYSTVAEAVAAGTRYGFVHRPRFPESQVLMRYAQERMTAMEIPLAEYVSGQWLGRLDALMALPAREPDAADGAGEVAGIILELLG